MQHFYIKHTLYITILHIIIACKEYIYHYLYKILILHKYPTYPTDSIFNTRLPKSSVVIIIHTVPKLAIRDGNECEV